MKPQLSFITFILIAGLALGATLVGVIAFFTTDTPPVQGQQTETMDIIPQQAPAQSLDAPPAEAQPFSEPTPFTFETPTAQDAQPRDLGDVVAPPELQQLGTSQGYEDDDDDHGEYEGYDDDDDHEYEEHDDDDDHEYEGHEDDD